MNNVTDAVIVFDNQGQLLFQNEVFGQLNDELSSELTIALDKNLSSEEEAFTHQGKLVKRIDLEDGVAFVIEAKRDRESIAERTIRELSSTVSDAEHIYTTSAKAIFTCLDWRWIVITQFKSPERLDVLAFLDNGVRQDEYEYDFANTPCEHVVNTNQFTMFTDVNMSFPDYDALNALGAKTYAGLVYRGANNEPLGHVMAIHDKRDVDFNAAEQVICAATTFLSSHFQLLKTKSELAEADALSKVGCLTNIGNRQACRSTLNTVEQRAQDSGELNWTIALVELDYIKQLNDENGSDVGDRFLQLMASEMTRVGRTEGYVFRIESDRFKLIYRQSTSVFVSSLVDRFEQAIERVRLTLNYYVSANIGFAMLNEVDGDIDAWVNLANERLYETKTKNKRAFGLFGVR